LINITIGLGILKLRRNMGKLVILVLRIQISCKKIMMNYQILN